MQNKNVLCNKDAKSLEQHLRVCSLCAGLSVELQEAIKAAELITIDQHKVEAIFQKTRIKLEFVLADDI